MKHVSKDVPVPVIHQSYQRKGQKAEIVVTGSDDQVYKLNTETGFINFKAEKLNSKNQQHKSIHSSTAELSETGQ